MARLVPFGGFCVLAIVLASASFGTADGPKLGHSRLPIIDVHFHPAPAWDTYALAKLFDELGVAAAGNGARDADAIATKFAQE